MVQDKLHEVWSIEKILLQTSLGELVLARKDKGVISYHCFYPLHFPISLIVKSDTCSDPRFYNQLQFDTYHSVYFKKGFGSEKWEHVGKQDELKAVIPLFDSCDLL